MGPMFCQNLAHKENLALLESQQNSVQNFKAAKIYKSQLNVVSLFPQKPATITTITTNKIVTVREDDCGSKGQKGKVLKLFISNNV